LFIAKTKNSILEVKRLQKLQDEINLKRTSSAQPKPKRHAATGIKQNEDPHKKEVIYKCTCKYPFH
jgi:hypothetical protein